MNKLLSAGFLRLWRNRAFHVCLLVMIGLPIYIVINQNNLAKSMRVTLSIESSFFAYTVIIAVVLAAFISLFFGVEYSDGTIRNKIMIGHSRVSIYLTNFILAVAAGLIMIFAYILTMLLVGVPLLDFFKAPFKVLLGFFIASILVLAAFVAIYMFITMLISNKAITVALSLLTCFVLYAITMTISQRLSEPEFYDGYSYDIPNANGSITIIGDNFEKKKIENPAYLRGEKRERYQFAFDFLPLGQGFQITSMIEDANLLRMQICSIGITIVMTGAGVAIFRKKNIK